jgi:hypothetical protein
LVVRDTSGFAELARIPLSDPRRVVELADGALFAVGSDAVVRLDERAKDPERYGRIPLFPESLVLADHTTIGAWCHA